MDLFNKVMQWVADNSDGETSTDSLIETYGKDNNISDEIIEGIQKRAFTEAALDAGIPLSVIEGKTKLSDHFSKEYIDFQKNPKGFSE